MIDPNNDIAQYTTDSQLTMPDNRKRYNYKEMIKLSEKLGRPLNETETEKFLIKESAT